MTTKSFTSELEFDRKTVDNLLKVLDKDSKANVVPVKYSNISNNKAIKKMFTKSSQKAN